VYGSLSDSTVATDVVSRSTPEFYHMNRAADAAQPSGRDDRIVMCMRTVVPVVSERSSTRSQS
jgi:hypothetical protein